MKILLYFYSTVVMPNMESLFLSSPLESCSYKDIHRGEERQGYVILMTDLMNHLCNKILSETMREIKQVLHKQTTNLVK